MANNSLADEISQTPGITGDFTPEGAFKLIDNCREENRRIVPLFGGGISVRAGIPISSFLADYICAVCSLAEKDHWSDYRGYLRKYGWPHRHDTWMNWFLDQKEKNNHFLSPSEMDQKFQAQRQKLYHKCVTDEVRRFVAKSSN